MLKRHLAILSGAAILSMQAFYVGAQGTFPPSTDDKALLPATEKYFADRQVENVTAVLGTVFPPSTDDARAPLPAERKHFSDMQIEDPSPTGASGIIFPPSTDDPREWTSPEEGNYSERTTG